MTVITTIKDLKEYLKDFDENTPIIKMNSAGIGHRLYLSELYMGKVTKLDHRTYKEDLKDGDDVFIV